MSPLLCQHFENVRSTSVIGFLLPCASGLLLALCFPPYDYTLLAWVALVPLAAAFSLRGVSRAVCTGGYCGGFVFHAISLNWIRTCYGGTGFSGTYAVGYLVACHLGALTFLLVVWLGRGIVKKRNVPATLFLPVLWVSFEAARYEFVRLIDQTGFNWLQLGATLSVDSEFVQLADIGGVSLLSMLIAMANGLWIDLFSAGAPFRAATKARVASMSFVVATLAVGWSYGAWRASQFLPADGPVVCLVGKNELPPLVFPQRIKAATDGPRPDLLLWSERAYHQTIVDIDKNEGGSPAEIHRIELRRWPGESNREYGQRVRNDLSATAAQLGAAVAIGCDRLDVRGGELRRMNSLAFADPNRGYLGCYDKRHLAPYAEFLPYQDWFGSWMTTDDFTHGADPYSFPLQWKHRDRPLRIGAAICYDACFPHHFRDCFRASANGDSPDLFVQIGSEGQDETACLSEWMLKMAQLRAIETRRPIVRHCAFGYSGVIDGNGRIRQLLGRETIEKPIVLSRVPLDSRASAYIVLGDWPVMLGCSGLLIVLAVGITCRHRRQEA